MRNTVKQGLTYDKSSDAYIIAEELQKKIDKGEDISANDMAELFEAMGENQQAEAEQTEENDREFDIKKTTDNELFVEVTEDILNGVPEADWVNKVKQNLKQKFPDGITAGNNQISIDKQSRREMTFSKYMQWLYSNDPQLREDKLRATNNADEILLAASDWVNEGPNHPRKDNIRDFARGTVLLRVGENDYSADVVVGTRKNGEMLLYDVLNLQRTSFTEKETDAAITVNPSPGASRSTAPISDNSIIRGGEKSNSENQENYSSAAQAQEVVQQDTDVPPMEVENDGKLALLTAQQQEEQEAKRRAMEAAKTELERSAIENDVPEETYKTAKRISDIIGREVRFYKPADPQENGYYSRESGVIYVNANSKNPIAQVIGHELTHALESTGGYKKLENLVRQYMKGSGENVDRRIKQKIEIYARHGKTLTQEGAMREIVAEYMEKNLLTDEQSIRQTVLEDRSLGERILSWLNNVLAKLGNKNAQERAFVSRARDIYAKALRETQAETELKKSAPSGVDDIMQRTLDMMEYSYGESDEELEGVLEDESEAGIRMLDYDTLDGKRRQEDVQYSISETTDGRAVAVVDGDILSDINTENWNSSKRKRAVRAAKEAMLNFKGGVPVNGVNHKVNSDSRNEYTRSRYTDQLYRNSSSTFADKMRAANNIDDIIIATTSWVNDGGLTHERKDNFVDFAHGDVLIQAGENQYEADTVVGITSGGNYVFYDVVDMIPTEFEKKEGSPTAAFGDSAASNIQGDPSTEMIPEDGDAVNSELLSESGETNQPEWKRELQAYLDERKREEAEFESHRLKLPGGEDMDSESRQYSVNEDEADDHRLKLPGGEDIDTENSDQNSLGDQPADEGDIQYSISETADGTEVYETSEEVRRMPYKQRMEVFMNIMRNEYRGRTAKFTANGDVYYAKFDEDDLRKNIYGDKKSSPRGWRAKINTGADGNIFELVENAQYSRSGTEQGKTTVAHQNLTGWEYFVKTVQIDGLVYDLLANVRKKPNGEYVYSIQLNENKNKTPAPPRHYHNDKAKAENRPVRVPTDVSADSITEYSDTVNMELLPESGETNQPEWKRELQAYLDERQREEAEFEAHRLKLPGGEGIGSESRQYSVNEDEAEDHRLRLPGGEDIDTENSDQNSLGDQPVDEGSTIDTVGSFLDYLTEDAQPEDDSSLPSDESSEQPQQRDLDEYWESVRRTADRIKPNTDSEGFVSARAQKKKQTPREKAERTPFIIQSEEDDTVDISTKNKLAETYAGISEAELARRIGTTSQALGQRIKTGKFSSSDLDKIAAALGAEFVCSFRFPDGTEI